MNKNERTIEVLRVQLRSAMRKINAMEDEISLLSYELEKAKKRQKTEHHF
jgi:hypothetical protein